MSLSVSLISPVTWRVLELTGNQDSDKGSKRKGAALSSVCSFSVRSSNCYHFGYSATVILRLSVCMPPGIRPSLVYRWTFRPASEEQTLLHKHAHTHTHTPTHIHTHQSLYTACSEAELTQSRHTLKLLFFLGQLRHLQVLNISNVSQLSPRVVEAVTACCPALETLAISLNRAVDDQCLRHIVSHCPKLKCLSCVACSLSDLGQCLSCCVGACVCVHVCVCVCVCVCSVGMCVCAM